MKGLTPLMLLCCTVYANTTINNTDTVFAQKIEYENDPNQVAETATIQSGETITTKPHLGQSRLLHTIVAEDLNINFFYVKSLTNHPECVISIDQKDSHIKIEITKKCEEDK